MEADGKVEEREAEAGLVPAPVLTEERESMLEELEAETGPPQGAESAAGAEVAADTGAEEAAADADAPAAGAGAAAAADEVTTKQSLVYNVSLTYNKMLSLPGAYLSQGGRPWWTPLQLDSSVEGLSPPYGTIVLGALPLKTEQHLETLVNATVSANGFNAIRAVLTLNKPFELQPTYLNTPVSEEDWRAAGVQQKIFAVEDFNRPTPEQFDEACKFIDEQMAQNNTVYVHCKAGRGRSCAVVCCYLVHRGMSAEAAMHFVKQRRPHVSLGEAQQAAVGAFEAQLNERRAVGAAVEAIDVVGGGCATAAAALREDDEPTAIALKQKPKFRTWPTRFIAIRDKRLLVFENKDDFDSWKQNEGTDGASQSQRQTSIDDLTDCTITKGMEKFTLHGEYFKLTVQHPEGFNQRKDTEAHFAFQAEYDRERFYKACENISQHRKWNQDEPGQKEGDDAAAAAGAEREAEPEPEGEPEGEPAGAEPEVEPKAKPEPGSEPGLTVDQDSNHVQIQFHEQQPA